MRLEGGVVKTPENGGPLRLATTWPNAVPVPAMLKLTRRHIGTDRASGTAMASAEASSVTSLVVRSMSVVCGTGVLITEAVYSSISIVASASTSASTSD
jgi:hypothetical protein